MSCDDLRDELASSGGAAMVGIEDGGTVQTAIQVAPNPASLKASTQSLSPNSIVRTADGYLYKVLAPEAANFDMETDGDVKLDILPTAGYYRVSALALNGAANAALNRLLARGNTMIDEDVALATSGDSVNVPEGTELRMATGAKITVPEGWTNKAALNIAGTATGVALIETDASPRNGAKDQALNVGFNVVSGKARLVDCIADGFGFPFVLRNFSGDASRNGAIFVRCHGMRGYSWGFEIDSAANVLFDHCSASFNGYDGFKQMNQHGYLAQQNVYNCCTAVGNGQRDFAAGGSENANGNGWDFYQGGIAAHLIGCIAQANYGSGLNFKGGTSAHPEMGMCRVLGGDFSGNLAVATGNSHGIELGGDIGDGAGSVGQSLMTIVGARIADNEGAGINNGGSYAVSVTACTIARNRISNVTERIGSEGRYSDCHIVRGGGANINVGQTNDGSLKRKNISFLGCYVSASYDPFMDARKLASDTPREAITITGIDTGTDTITVATHPFDEGDTVSIYRSTNGGTMPGGLSESSVYWVRDITSTTFTLSTTRHGAGRVNITSMGLGTLVVTRDSAEGLSVLSDSAEVHLIGCSFYNHWSQTGHISNRGRLNIREAYFGEARTSFISGIFGFLRIRDCAFGNLLTTMNTSAGGIAINAGGSDLRRLNFARTGSGTSYAVRLFNSSGPHRWEELEQSGFSKLIEVGSVTFDLAWTQRGRGNAAPTTGYWTRGAVFDNSEPSAGGPPGWVCTAAGEAGTWKAMAALTA